MADEKARHARPVRLEHARLPGLRRRRCVPVAVDEVEPSGDATAQVCVPTVDPGVEERDRDAVPAEAGEHDLGAAPPVGLEVAARDRLGRRGGRVDRADRVHAGDVVRPLELGEGPRGDERREAVESSGEDLLARDPNLPLAQARQQQLLCAFGLGVPLALLLGARLFLDRAQAVGERGRGEDDEHALTSLEGRLGAIAEDAVPRARRRARDRVARALHRAGQDERGRHQRERRERRRPPPLRPPWHTHPTQDTRETGWPA